MRPWRLDRAPSTLLRSRCFVSSIWPPLALARPPLALARQRKPEARAQALPYALCTRTYAREGEVRDGSSLDGTSGMGSGVSVEERPSRKADAGRGAAGSRSPDPGRRALAGGTMLARVDPSARSSGRTGRVATGGGGLQAMSRSPRSKSRLPLSISFGCERASFAGLGSWPRIPANFNLASKRRECLAFGPFGAYLSTELLMRLNFSAAIFRNCR